jgi:hypothetical protein
MVEIDHRSSSPERGLRQTARQKKAPSAKFYCSLKERCSAECFSCGVRISAGRGISRRATVWFLLQGTQVCRAPQETVFFAPAVFLRQAERHVGVDQLLSLQEI